MQKHEPGSLARYTFDRASRPRELIERVEAKAIIEKRGDARGFLKQLDEFQAGAENRLYDLLPEFETLADPLKDEEGLSLAMSQERVRARKSGGLDNDF